MSLTMVVAKINSHKVAGFLPSPPPYPLGPSRTAFLGAGIIYVSDTELGWEPVVKSWLAKKEAAHAAALSPCFDK